MADLARFIGSEAEYSLEHRILNTMLLIGIAISVVTAFSNYLLGLGLMAAVSAVCSLVLGGLYYLSVVKRLYAAALKASIALILVVVPVLWVFNGGVLGTTSFYIIIFSAMIAVSIKGAANVAALVGVLTALTLGLVVFEYNNPDVVYDYSSRATLYADTYVSMLIAIIVITLLYVVILNYYRKEHARAAEYQVKIEKQQLQLEVARLDRLSLIGEMAAGIGHEVRNPLTTIRGFLQLFQRKQEYNRHREQIEIMIGEIDRANAIITEFLSLAKNKVARIEPCDFDLLLEHIFPLIQARALQEGKEVVMDLGGVPPVPADEGEIRQLVLNLVGNALDAVTPGGTVTISTRRTARRLVLAVRDTGAGIPPEIFARLGTPFVTSKDKGTGLGIPICYRIAERHKARIDVETGPAGTTFRVEFAIP